MTASSMPDEPLVAIVDSQSQLGTILRQWNLVGSAVLVSVGGAALMDDDALQLVEGLLTDLVLPLLSELGAVVVDGGTDSGVMAAMGRARAVAPTVPLVGVVARGTVLPPGIGSGPDAASVDGRHSHQLLVPGAAWGDESPWLSDVATAIADGRPSVTLVSNGGETTFRDVENSLLACRPVVVLAGSGRTADLFAAARRVPRKADLRVRDLVDSPLLDVVSAVEREVLANTLRLRLTRASPPRPGPNNP